MSIPTLDIEKATAIFNADERIVMVTYRGLLDGETSTQVYNWLADLIETIGIENIYGEIFDFRDVQEFMPDNLMDARRNSRRHNLKNNVKKLPVVMVISNHVQEEILRGPMQNVEENKRKTIVWNMDDAHAFLNQWHAEHAIE